MAAPVQHTRRLVMPNETGSPPLTTAGFCTQQPKRSIAIRYHSRWPFPTLASRNLTPVLTIAVCYSCLFLTAAKTLSIPHLPRGTSATLTPGRPRAPAQPLSLSGPEGSEDPECTRNTIGLPAPSWVVLPLPARPAISLTWSLSPDIRYSHLAGSRWASRLLAIPTPTSYLALSPR